MTFLKSPAVMQTDCPLRVITTEHIDINQDAQLLAWCNFLTYAVILIIVRSIQYHLCEKTLNKKGRR